MSKEMRELQFVDSNCMLGQWKHHSGGCLYDAGQLLEYLDRHGINRALTFGAFAAYGDIRTGNDRLLEHIKGYDRLMPCAAAMPHHTNECPPPGEFCAFLARHDIRAVRVFPRLHGVSLYSWIWGDLFAELEVRRIPLFIDFSVKHWTEEIDWGNVHGICEAFPRLPVILVRMGIQADRYVYPLFGKFENLYMETSYYMVNNGMEHVVRNFGAHRLLFGSGMPVCNPRGAVWMLRLSGIGQEEQAMIAGGNLMNLLRGVDFDGKQRA